MRRVLSFRPKEVGLSERGAWLARLEGAGFCVQEVALLEIVPSPGAEDSCRAAAALPVGDWLFFTSKNAARIFLHSIGENALPTKQRIACVGPHTAEMFPGAVDFVGLGGDAKSLAKELIEFLKQEPGKHRITFLKAKLASQEPASILRSAGYEVTEQVVYDSVPRDLSAEEIEILRQGLADRSSILLFSNAETVRMLADRTAALGVRLDQFQGLKIAAIGSQTAARLKSYGLKVDIIPAHPSLDALAEEIVRQER